MQQTQQETLSYDVVVIGGGAAGLSGALALGRARRSVLVVDAGEPRNAPAAAVHNYLGQEGVPPGELVARGRREVQQYGVQVLPGTVEATARRDEDTFTLTVQPADGDAVTVLARRLLVTSGLVDELPTVPGVAEGWGRTVLHCPFCHGWEVRDRTIAVLGAGPLSVHQVLLWRNWSANVVYLRHDAPELDAQAAEQLIARGVRVVDGQVAAWLGDAAQLVDGQVVPADALVVGAPVRARTAALESLGLTPTRLEQAGHLIGWHLTADPVGATGVPGVWAAGNVADPRAQVITAAAAGLQAGAAIVADLIAQDTREAVDRHRVFSAAAWDERYRQSPDRIWSGNPNAVLVTEAATLRPGRALDVGCGEGADALWLAEQGWEVTGTDISAAALTRAQEHARARGQEVSWVAADLRADPPRPGGYDLVTAHFMHLPTPERTELYRNLVAAVAPGGTLLVVGHDRVDEHVNAHGADNPWARYDMFFTAEQLVAELDLSDWLIEVAESRARTVTDDQGGQETRWDAVLRARRPR